MFINWNGFAPDRGSMDIRAWARRIPAELRYALLLFVTTRIALTIIGLISRTMIKAGPHAFSFSGIPWLDIWGVWDSSWYMDIATGGYSTILRGTYANYAFFPLYPLLMRTLGHITGGPYIAGLIISNIALLVACVYLYRLVKLDADKSAALASVKYLFLFPVAFVFSGVFTESLFLALVLACFYYARLGRWWLVGILGFFAGLTRYIGALLLAPLLWEYALAKKFRVRAMRWDVLFLLLIPAGLAVFLAFSYTLTGDWLAYFHIQQQGWGHYLSNPFMLLWRSLSLDKASPVQGAFAAIGLILLLLGWKRLRFSYWFYGMYSILVPLIGLGNWLAGMPRYVAIVFPLFILLAGWGRNRMMDTSITVMLALLQGCFMVFWAVASYLMV